MELLPQTVLTDFRPVFALLFLIAVVFLFLSIVPRGRNSKINFITILIVSIIEVLTGGVLLYVESGLVEALGVTPDSITLYLCIGVILISIANPFIFRKRNGRNRSYRYHG